ncbi:MAG: hypothetical protein NVS3B25_25140 [Hymenobacter sp.]
MTTPIAAEVVTKALANSPFTPAMRKNTILENATYSTPLPADTYVTELTPTGEVDRFGFVIDANGKLVPEASKWTRDGEHEVAGVKVAHKAGDPILTPTGNPAYKATGQYVRASSGARVRIYDSVLNRLSASPKKSDQDLFASLTGNGAHDVFFTGAISVQVEQTVIEGRGYTQANLVEA